MELRTVTQLENGGHFGRLVCTSLDLRCTACQPRSSGIQCAIHPPLPESGQTGRGSGLLSVVSG